VLPPYLTTYSPKLYSQRMNATSKRTTSRTQLAVLASWRAGGPFCAVPKRHKSVKAYRGTVLLARLFREALVGLSVVRVLRVEFVGRAVFLQCSPGLVLVLKSVAKIVMGVAGVRVEA